MDKSAATHLLLQLTQYTRREALPSRAVTLGTMATLLAVCEQPGVAQADLKHILGGLDAGTVTRQLALLRGLDRAGHRDPELPELVYEAHRGTDRRAKFLYPTERGEAFAAGLAAYTGRVLRQVAHD